MHVVLAGVHRLVGRGQARCPGRDAQDVGPRPVRAQLIVEHLSAVLRGAQHRRAGPVAEQDARSSVGIVRHARERLGSDEQDVAGHAGGNEGAAPGQAVDEPAARGFQIAGHRMLRADGRLHQASGGGEQMVGRAGGHQDGVEFPGLHLGVLQGTVRGLDRQIAGGLVVGGNVPLPDARPLDDPLVRGIDQPFQVMVGQHAFGHVAAQACELHRQVLSTLHMPFSSEQAGQAEETPARGHVRRPRAAASLRTASSRWLLTLWSTNARASRMALQMPWASEVPCVMMVTPLTPRRGAPPYSL